MKNVVVVSQITSETIFAVSRHFANSRHPFGTDPHQPEHLCALNCKRQWWHYRVGNALDVEDCRQHSPFKRNGDKSIASSDTERLNAAC